jgi:uncharacterized membrane protein
MESRLFKIAMYWRLFYGTFRILLGLALLKLINVPLADLLYRVMGKELTEDPSDLIFTIVNTFLQLHPLSITYFLSGYLIFWGIVDIFLSANLLKDRLWAFPVSLWLISLFVVYELYRFYHTHSQILLCVILVDIVILGLIQREYKKVSTIKCL